MKLIFIFHQSPLHLAVEKNNVNIVRLLLERNGFNINDKLIISLTMN